MVRVRRSGATDSFCQLMCWLLRFVVTTQRITICLTICLKYHSIHDVTIVIVIQIYVSNNKKSKDENNNKQMRLAVDFILKVEFCNDPITDQLRVRTSGHLHLLVMCRRIRRRVRW